MVAKTGEAWQQRPGKSRQRNFGENGQTSFFKNSREECLQEYQTKFHGSVGQICLREHGFPYKAA